jgi:hypothetical protein
MLEEKLREINELALWDYTATRTDDDTLLILGSNDLDYYHHLEIEFRGVVFTDLPSQFSHAQFRLGMGTTEDDPTIWINAESWDTLGTKDFEVQAAKVEVRIGTVYYYDRENLKPGERIASWVKRREA